MKSRTISALALIAVLGIAASAYAQGVESAPGTSQASGGGYYGGYYGGYGPGQGQGGSGSSGSAGSSCNPITAIRSVSIGKRKRGVRLSFRRASRLPIDIDVARIARGSSPNTISRQSLVARFKKRTGGVNWSGKANRKGRKVVDGVYVVRYLMRDAAGKPVDVQRIALRRSKGKFYKWPGYFHRRLCQNIASFELGRPVFGGKAGLELVMRYRINAPARVTLRVLRGRSVVATLLRNELVQSTTMQRLTFGPSVLRRGTYRIELKTEANGRTETVVLKARRL